MKRALLFDFELSIPSDFLLFSFSFNVQQLLLPFYFHEDSSNTVHFAKEMGSTDESYLKETCVESLTGSLTQQQFPEQRFLEDADYDDTSLEEMLYNAHRENVCHSQREGLSVGQSSSVSERTGRAVVERTGRLVESGQELNTEHAQIRTLLDRQRAQILADCQAEMKKHELQANYDRRSTQKLSETIESQ